MTVSYHFRGVDEGLGCRMGGVPADIQFTCPAVVVIAAPVMHLTLAKVRQYVGIGPARITQGVPIIEVALMAANVNHAIDGAAAAQNLAAWLVTDTTFQAGLRHRLECPIHMPAGQDGSNAYRSMDQRRAVLGAGLEQAHSNFRIGTETVGQHAAS
ncbi:hypothetical protein D9M71_129150 [compost metagenome]